MTDAPIWATTKLDIPFGVVTKSHLIRWANALPDTASVGVSVNWDSERVDGLVATWELP